MSNVPDWLGSGRRREDMTLPEHEVASPDLGFYVFWIVAATLYGGPDDDGAATWRVPLADDGRACPWPFDPIGLVGAPLGQYHCPYCGSMVLAGVPHVDYRDTD